MLKRQNVIAEQREMQVSYIRHVELILKRLVTAGLGRQEMRGQSEWIVGLQT